VVCEAGMVVQMNHILKKQQDLISYLTFFHINKLFVEIIIVFEINLLTSTLLSYIFIDFQFRLTIIFQHMLESLYVALYTTVHLLPNLQNFSSLQYCFSADGLVQTKF
jgi:hypothetical protein